MVTVGMVIGARFRVDHILGSGGMGVVVSATHLELGHKVAIKFLREDMTSNPTVVERFLREARAVVQLRTEHVCRATDVGRSEDGAPYIVMEMLEGSDLGRVVAKQPLPITIAVEYVLQACVAIAEAHAAGIVHRDLKPANLFVTRRPGGGPLIKVLDFGIAKAMAEAGAQLTLSDSMLGSPGYMSPEQLRSARDVDARTDIWALGATLYQLLSARLPFYRANAAEMATRIVAEPPDPIEIDPALSEVIVRCLEKEPAKRYGDVAALAAELAPFGGPSGKLIAAQVRQVRSGGAPAEPAVAAAPVSAYASTAASSEATNAEGARAAVRSPARSTGPAKTAAAARDVPNRSARAASPRLRRRPWWWFAAPLVAIAGFAGTLVFTRQSPSAPSGQGSAAVAGEPAKAVPPDAGSVAIPLDAGVANEIVIEGGVVDAGAGGASQRPKEPHKEQRKAVATAKPASKPTSSAAKSTSGGGAKPASGGGSGAKPASGSGSGSKTIGRQVADSAREAKASCLENTADTPYNTTLCWCAKKDQARAQASFAKLSGVKRTTAREFCSVRGIKL